jgi:hypothetical protein
MLSKPDVDMNLTDAAARFAVIEATFKKAVAEGDKNVRLINGTDLFAGPDRRECTVDGCHPTDLGFFSMAKALGDLIETIL